MNSINTKDITNRRGILKSIPLFCEMENSMLNEIASILVEKNIGKDQSLFKKGDLDYALYLIVEGKVMVHDGDHIFAYFIKNQYIGEYSLLDSSPRSATVTAVTPTKLLRFDQDSFIKLIIKHPQINSALLKGLVLRLRDYNKLESDLTNKNIEVEKQKKELEKQRKELEALNATKDKFFAIIAHDLKNPFSTVLGISELLAREFESFDPESLKTFIYQIYKYSNSTYNLLENLLQWSMLQTGRIPLHPQIVNVIDVIKENVDLLMGNSKQKDIQVFVQPCKNCFAYIDVNQITTVVRNLLTNAIKFTAKKGMINIAIESNDDFWTISIKDNGIGIAKKDIEKLFLLDSNPTTIGTSKEKGTGLGLILCKEFVERNGGKIWVHSDVGLGTTFYFTIPKSDPEREHVQLEIEGH